MFPLLTHSPPHHLISSRSLGGSPLILRLRDGRKRWLRVHEDGSLERCRGDERCDFDVAPLPARATERSTWLRDTLREFLQPGDLTTRCQFDHNYPVQAFVPGEPVIEGWVGVEYDMGCHTDTMGLRSRGRHFDVRRADERAVVDELDALLALLDRVVVADGVDELDALLARLDQ